MVFLLPLGVPRSTRLFILLSTLLSLFLVIQAASPDVKVNTFSNLPAKIAYIDDSTVAFYHDSTKGDVWRTEDEGKTWNLVSGPKSGSAYLLIEHPYDKNMVRYRRIADGSVLTFFPSDLHLVQLRQTLEVYRPRKDMVLIRDTECACCTYRSSTRVQCRPKTL